MPKDNSYIDTNKKLWDAKTAAHTDSGFYNMEGFLAGDTSLKEIELELLGDIKGKSILHLQCHFGQDSLSLARMGAKVTAVDLSDAAITKARELNQQLGLDVKFICTDLYSLPEILNQKFDIVFSSYGTVVWLPDLPRWANVIAQYLNTNGRFVFADFHPILMMYDDDISTLKYPYFNKGVIEETESGTYADRNANISLKSNTWNHGFADILQSLISAGLSLTIFREFDYSPYACFGNMREVAPGRYQVKGMEGIAPLTYALEARSANRPSRVFSCIFAV